MFTSFVQYCIFKCRVPEDFRLCFDRLQVSANVTSGFLLSLIGGVRRSVSSKPLANPGCYTFRACFLFSAGNGGGELILVQMRSSL